MNTSPVIHDQYTHVTHSMRHEARSNLMRQAWHWYDQAIEQQLGFDEIELRGKILVLYQSYITRACTCLPDGDACKSCQAFLQMRALGLENYGTPVPWID